MPSMLESWAARRAAGYTECSPKCEARRHALTGDALRAYEANRAHYYSEAVLDRAAIEAELPHSILAFFYIAGVNETVSQTTLTNASHQLLLESLSDVSPSDHSLVGVQRRQAE